MTDGRASALDTVRETPRGGGGRVIWLAVELWRERTTYKWEWEGETRLDELKR